MLLEIVYTFKEDKHSEETTHFAYCHCKSNKFDVAFKEASKYFTKLVRESGWNKKATLKSICNLKNETTIMDVVRVKPPSKSRKRACNRKSPAPRAKRKSS